MQTTGWKKVRIANGKYHVMTYTFGDSRSSERIPGLIIGGNGKWLIELDGKIWGNKYRTADSAAADLVKKHFNLI